MPLNRSQEYSEICESIAKMEDVQRKLAFLLASKPSYKEVAKAKARYKESELNRRLKATPVTELNSSHVGIRIKSLSDAGINNVLQVKDISFQQLTQLKGIGPGNANLIYGEVKRLINEVQEQIHFDLDSISLAEKGEILRAVYIYLHLSAFWDICKTQFDPLEEILKKYEGICSYKKGRIWFWTVRSRSRTAVYEKAQELNRILTANTVEQINQACNIKKHIMNISVADANENYKKRKEIYQKCILSESAVTIEDSAWNAFAETPLPLPKEFSNSSESKKISPSWGAISVIIAVVLIATIGIGTIKTHMAQRDAIYTEALSCIENAEYNTAYELLSGIPSYKDANELMIYCRYADYYISNKETKVIGLDELSSISLKHNGEYQKDIVELIEVATKLKKDQEAANKLAAQQIETEKKKKLIEYYSEIFPELGMNEKYLKYTKLGPATSVEKCLNFDHLDPRARSKEYTWGSIKDKENYFSVTVEYRKHLSNQVDDYVEYEDGEGFVFSISYYKDGYLHTEDMIGRYDLADRPGVKFCVSDFRQSQEWCWKAGQILA